MAEIMAAVGWQGITLQAPLDWSLVGVSGDAKKGYFRVDGPVASAVEVRWSTAFKKTPDLMAKAREFLSDVEKACKKRKVRFSSDLKQDGDAVNFLWRADRLGQGRLIYCPECDRVIIAQIVSSRGENIAQIAPVMLKSLKDHRDDGWVDWALYGLQFAVPKGYGIQKQSLMSQYLALHFRDKARLLTVERWGLASTLISKDDLAGWYRKDALPDIKGYKVKVEPKEIFGCNGLKVEGRRGGIIQALRALAYSFTLHPHPKYLTGYVWYSEDANRIFSVRATHGKGEDVAERVRDLVQGNRIDI